MKVFQNTALFALSAALLIGCAACDDPTTEGGGDQTAYTDPNTRITTYDNKSYNEYLLGENAVIENQILRRTSCTPCASPPAREKWTSCLTI